MNVWELRQAIESAIPVWVEVVAVVAALIFIGWAAFIRKGPGRR